MKNKFTIKRLLILLLAITALLGTSTFIPNELSSVSYASAIGDRSNFEGVYEALDSSYTIKDATIVIIKASFRDFTDEDMYDLMSLTYTKEYWMDPVEQYDIYKLRILIAEKGNWINEYYKKTLIDPDAMVLQYKLEIIWPPNDGFLRGIHDAYNLEVGTIVDRYGYPGGRFLSPVGTEYKERALAPGTKESKPYYQYKVIKEFPVAAGEIAPWFGVYGGGQQYYTSHLTVQDYIDQGYLVKIEN